MGGFPAPACKDFICMVMPMFPMVVALAAAGTVWAMLPMVVVPILVAMPMLPMVVVPIFVAMPMLPMVVVPIFVAMPMLPMVVASILVVMALAAAGTV